MKRTLRTIAGIAALGIAATGCTPSQIQAWVDWHDTDPAAADAFLETPVFQELSDDGLQQAERLNPPAPQQSTNSVWDRLAECESGGNWSINTGAFDGGLQFLPSTWRSMGGTQYAPYAWQATREQQIAIAEKTLAAGGWGQWPGCARKLGLL
jgi:Transglycosylase-like domain